MAKIIQLQRDAADQFRPVIVEDNWTVLRATEAEPLDDRLDERRLGVGRAGRVEAHADTATSARHI